MGISDPIHEMRMPPVGGRCGCGIAVLTLWLLCCDGIPDAVSGEQQVVDINEDLDSPTTERTALGGPIKREALARNVQLGELAGSGSSSGNASPTPVPVPGAPSPTPGPTPPPTTAPTHESAEAEAAYLQRQAVEKQI